MMLNEVSFVHKHIRQLCLQIEIYTGMKLMTNLSEEFEQIRFMSRLSYITIDIKRSTCFVLSYSLSNDEWEAIQDIMIYCEWLETGKKVAKMIKKANAKKSLRKKIKRKNKKLVK